MLLRWSGDAYGVVGRDAPRRGRLGPL